jgi:Bacterial archaeo-eukaryotic release factor family 10
MTRPTLQDARKLSDWRPPLGVVSVYLGFDPADRSGAWRIALRNGIDRALEPAGGADHEHKIALRETARRLLERFDGREVRPPPHGEAGFLEVSRGEGVEHWWGTGVPPAVPSVLLGDQPAVVQLVDLCRRGEGCGVALVSAERVRLLRFGEGDLEEIEEWTLSIASGDWRERKSQSTRDPSRAQGVSSSGHDQYDERLEHNRRRFLAECGRLAGKRLQGQGLGEVVVFGSPPEVESFCAGLGSTAVQAELGSEADLISSPTGQLIEEVSAALARLAAERDRALIERALEEARGGNRGATGLQETMAALGEGRVEHVAFDPAIGAPAEALVRGALAGGTGVTVVSNGIAELLEPAEGVAAILRY